MFLGSESTLQNSILWCWDWASMNYSFLLPMGSLIGSAKRSHEGEDRGQRGQKRLLSLFDSSQPLPSNSLDPTETFAPGDQWPSEVWVQSVGSAFWALEAGGQGLLSRPLASNSSNLFLGENILNVHNSCLLVIFCFLCFFSLFFILCIIRKVTALKAYTWTLQSG